MACRRTNVTIDELKAKLDLTDKPDIALAKLLDVVPGAAYNWRKEGSVSTHALKKAEMILKHGSVVGNGNTLVAGREMSPEVATLQGLMEHWDNKRRKKLLRMALELDEEA